MKVRIEMNGEIDGTRIFDAKTGQEIHVSEVTIVHRAGDAPVVTFRLPPTIATLDAKDVEAVKAEEMWKRFVSE